MEQGNRSDSTLMSDRQTSRDRIEPDARHASRDTAITEMLRSDGTVPPDRRALVAYSSWLAKERMHLCKELYPHLGWQASQFYVGQNAGWDYHRRGQAVGMDVPLASSRAVDVLNLVGCDWRQDSYLGIGDTHPAVPDAYEFPHPDGRLVALAREFFEAQQNWREARALAIAANEELERRERAFEESEARFLKWPPRTIGPKELEFRDYWTAQQVHQILGGRFRPYSDREAEAVDAKPRSFFEAILPELEQREARIEALNAELEIDRLWEESDARHDAAEKLAQKIYRIRACTFEGLALKAKVLKAHNPEHWERPVPEAGRLADASTCALGEIADAVEHLMTHGAAEVRTGTYTDPDLVTVEGGLGIDLLMMSGGIVDEDGRVNFCDAAGRVLRKPITDWIAFNANRLFAQAKKEIARQVGDPALSEPARQELSQKLRRDLRLDALKILAFRADEAFETSVAAENDLPEIPARRSSFAGQVSPNLIRAVEAHREAVQLMLHDPDDSDERTDINVARVRALTTVLCEFEPSTLADLNYKAIYLHPSVSNEIGDEEARDAMLSIVRDVQALANSAADSEAPITELGAAPTGKQIEDDAALIELGERHDKAVSAYLDYLPKFDPVQTRFYAEFLAEIEARDCHGEEAYIAVNNEIRAPYAEILDRGEALRADWDELAGRIVDLPPPSTLAGAAVIARVVAANNYEEWAKPARKRDWDERTTTELAAAVLRLAGVENVAAVAVQAAQRGTAQGAEVARG